MQSTILNALETEHKNIETKRGAHQDNPIATLGNKFSMSKEQVRKLEIEKPDEVFSIKNRYKKHFGEGKTARNHMNNRDWSTWMHKRNKSIVVKALPVIEDTDYTLYLKKKEKEK